MVSKLRLQWLCLAAVQAGTTADTDWAAVTANTLCPFLFFSLGIASDLKVNHWHYLKITTTAL